MEQALVAWGVNAVSALTDWDVPPVTSWSSAVIERATELTNRITRLTRAEPTHLLGLVRCSCQWLTINPSDSNPPDGTAQNPSPTSPRPLIFNNPNHTDLIVATGEESKPLQNPPKKKKLPLQSSVHLIYLVLFYRKICLFTCKSNIFIKEYEKRVRGDKRMANVHFTKAIKKTHSHMNESVLVIQLVLLAHPTVVNMTNM